MSKVLVLGLGNPVLGDDSVGWQVAARLPPEPDCEIDCLAVGRLRLMERMIGYQNVILIDAMLTGKNPPGSITCFTLDELPDFTAGHLSSIHDASLPAALKLGAALGAVLPEKIIIVGIETQCISEFTESLTPPVARAVPEAARLVTEILHEWMREA